MAIVINHRFFERLYASPASFKAINTIIIGTFNPGEPDPELLTDSERLLFEEIANTTKYRSFAAIKNFYDRPQNRFWGIMDRIVNEDFYKKHGQKARNRNGLKHYKGVDRDKVFERQSKFCHEYGVFITDIVASIKPATFENIYDNFPDSAVDAALNSPNTNAIIDAINTFKPQTVLFGFDTSSNSIPEIKREAGKIKSKFPDLIKTAQSPSGSALGDYESLVKDWREKIISR